MVLVAACASGLSAPLALPAAAQEAEADGRSLMERGAQMFWNGLRREMEPATDYFSDLAAQFGPSMRSFWEEMGPALSGIVEGQNVNALPLNTQIQDNDVKVIYPDGFAQVKPVFPLKA